MATLTVWRFPTPLGAEQAEQTLERLSKQELISIHDAAIVSFPEGAKQPKTKQLNNLTGAGALGGSFWGLLFGFIFFVPLLGMAVGAGVGALTGAFADVGIDDDFIQTMRDQIKPGMSALFLMSSDAVMDKVQEAFEGQPTELMHSNLTAAEEAKLRDVFAD